ncbi:hypothetical protein HOP50_02g16570 [Chloropicon primus]|uniref:Seipin n=1 Tax=Chloropicon primus TaxID=1764295 RepID=A0A5B8MFA1_9CHLO|nr:hypothetical protein A3770_02p16610 [Chloropicon primus]UPQ98351.1 hypothetical protein HOP50_02g16570 [Chloropicon primus]|eukprot:QDZ19143.1 hypothetical protein A3770_02p16610 [Chloropicon primus]
MEEYEEEGTSWEAEEEREGENEGTPVWQSALLFVTAALVIQGQIFLFSCALNLGVRHYVLPKDIAYQREFHPDYQAVQPVAYVPMLEEKFLTSGQLLHEPEDSSGLLVREGSYFDVWLKLSLPYSVKNEALFQVQVDLLALNSSSVFSSRKTCMMKRQNYLLRHVKLAVFAPLYLLGFLQDGEETLYFPVVDKFEQGKITNVGPTEVSQLRVTILSQKDRDPPEIYQAEAHILVKLNLLQHFLYHYPITSFVALSCALTVAMNVLLLGLIVVVLSAFLLGGFSLERTEETEDGLEGGEKGEGAPAPENDAAGEVDETETSGLTNVDLGGADEEVRGQANESSGEDVRDNTGPSWEPSTSMSEDMSEDTQSTSILKTGSKKFITEEQARRRA